MFNHKEPLTRQFVLSKITEEEIFHKYLGIVPNLTDYFTNPLRADTHADCKFYIDSRKVLKFNDLAYKVNLDCFNVVERLYNTNYNGALQQIAKDFNLYDDDINYDVIANISQLARDAKQGIGRNIQVKRKDFTKEEIYWFDQQGIHLPTLELFETSSINNAWIDGRLIYTYKRTDPGYVYYFGNLQYKLYFPFRDKYRFIQNTSNILQGYKQLPEQGLFLIITKSFKDVMCMYEYGIPAVAPLSEGALLTDEQYMDLSNRFFHIFTLFDRDRAGMRAAKKYRDLYGIQPLLFESDTLFRHPSEPKDFTDHHKRYGTNYMLDLIEETKQNLL